MFCGSSLVLSNRPERFPECAGCQQWKTTETVLMDDLNRITGVVGKSAISPAARGWGEAEPPCPFKEPHVPLCVFKE